MLGALIIVFREVIEAGLIVGILLAVTKGAPHSRRYIAGGVGAGVCSALIVAFFADALASAFAGRGQEAFNAAVLLVAAAMLAWHNIWMARHGRELAQELAATGRAVAAGEKNLFALSVVVGVAVLREGVEVVLFLYGILVSGETPLAMVAGGLGGLALGALVSAATYAGLAMIPTRRLFAVTSALIAFLAAGLAAQAAGFLQQGAIVTALARTAWDTSSILSDSSLLGRVMRTLVGYTDQPSQLQALVYLATLAAIFAATRYFAPRAPVPQPAPAE